METLDVSQKSYIMVSNMIGLAMKKEISWAILSSLLDEMSSTLVKSKQVIKILLKELENLNLNTGKDLNEGKQKDFSIVTNTNDELEIEENSVSEIEDINSEIEQNEQDTMQEEYNPETVNEEDEVFEEKSESDYKSNSQLVDEFKD